MADNLIFPIGFDLQKAVEEASQNWDKKYAKRLEQAIAKRPVRIKLEFEKLEDVKKRLAELKIQPITKETRSAIRELAKELQVLAKALEQVQKFSKTTQLGQRNFTNDVQMEKLRQANERLEIQKRRVALAEQKHAEAMQRSASKSKELGTELQKQEGYISRLIKRTAVYWSFNQVSTLLTRVRDVTAEFELQRVSLGAIIQDQQKANQLFGEIKSFALKSPLKILDLTKYTKQVAAYRIETDKLFDTTKRLADVSVGLGVDMGRLVLAYGQVKAASYLRAAEIRQFTEAGIPLLELLAEKFTELQGSAVSTEEVMDKVSRRMVSFSMVEEIFKDMTDAGGMFYNMQWKQSQTLYGMWAKMGDAAAVMYDQIGNTATVNSGMKYLIQLLQDSMLHWTAFANVLQTGVLGFAAYKAAMAGLVPFYQLNRIQIMASIKAEKAQQSLLLRRTSLYTKLTTDQLRQLVSTKKLTTAEWEEYITKNKLNQISALRLARMSKENAALQKALINQKLYTQAQLQQIQAMSKGQYVWATVKSAVMGVGGAIKSVAAMFKTFWPLAAITAVIDLLMDWRQAVEAQEAAVKKVDKQYEEMKVTLMEIENAYNDIKNASKSATESEEEFAKTSYSQKLEQLKNIMKLLSQFGLKNTIDPSVLNYENIDLVIDNWTKKLNEVNELSQKWGRSVAEVANAYEGNIFGWSIFGENLNEDMKDLSRSWTKLTVNTEFNNSLRQLKAIVGELANENKGVYDQISKAVGMDLKLALAQKRRNESEVQYQQRIYKNYQNIESYLQNFRNKGEYGGMLPSLSAADVADRFGDFKSDLDEVMHEVRKTIAAFENEEPMTIRMAIDQQFTLNEWEEWQKELVIQELNKDRLKAGLDLIPTLSSAATGAVAEGLKAIITSEFPGLFKDEELQSLVSAEGIVEAIKSKLDASTETLKQAVQLENNIGKGSARRKIVLGEIDKLQKEITDITSKQVELEELNSRMGQLTSEELERHTVLTAELENTDKSIVKTNQAKIAALVQMNDKYDQQIENLREIAKAEREAAQAALERVTGSGLTDLGEDVKSAFPSLMVDKNKQIEDKNYSSRYLVTDEELKNIKDVTDLYELWAKQTKAIADDKKKIEGSGLSEATIEAARAKTEAQRLKDEKEFADIERQMAYVQHGMETLTYNRLLYQQSIAIGTEAQQKAEQDLNKFLKEGATAEFAKLAFSQQGLKYTIAQGVAAEAANKQILSNFENMDNAEKFWEELGKRYNFKLPDKDNGRGGSGEDPWIILMKNRMKFMQDFQKGVEDLSKWMGYTKGLADEQENMLGRGLSLKIDSRKLNGTKDELIAWYEDAIGEVRKRIAKLGGKEWEGLGVQMILAKDTKSRVLKKYQELLADMFKALTGFRTEQMQSEMERKLKALADRISRTKTAKEFYDKIISTTGDYSLASKVAESIFGQNGSELRKALADQVRGMTGGIELPKGIISADNVIDYKALRGFAEENKNELGKMYEELIKISNDGQRDLAKTYEGYLKDLEKAKSYSDKRIELARTTAAKIREIEQNPQYTSEQKAELKRGFKEKEVKEAARLDFEAFKETPLYIKMFDDLEHISTTTLEMMKSHLENLKSVWGVALDPIQLKEFVDRIREIDEQIATRNPFKTLKSAYKDYKDAMKGISLQGAQANVGSANKERYERTRLYGADAMETRDAEKELKARREIYNIAKQLNGEDDKRLKSSEAIAKAQKLGLRLEQSRKADLDEALFLEKEAVDLATKRGVDVENDPGVKAAREKVAAAQIEYDIAKRVNGIINKTAEKSETLKDRLLKAGAEVSKYFELAGDVFHGIADITEVFGGSEEDVQYFNEVGDALSNIGSAVGDVVQAAISGNPMEVVSAVVNALPKMIVGFANLFSAGKIRKANKEIKRQQQLLEKFEYAYGRLEKAADKLFGRDYLNNYNQQIKVLQAQQAAYLKQAQAERSKGKKKDNEKIKEFENQAQETANKIKDLQDDLVAHFTGSSRTDMARQMAKSWIEARASMSDTFAAIKGDYSEMIKNMIVEGAAARVIENALSPMWEDMENMLEKNDVDGAIDALIGGMDSALNAANNGMEVLWKALEARGYDMKQLINNVDNGYTGIAKEVSSASSEEINANTAALNTQNYYVSHIPTISENVAVIRRLMEHGPTSKLPETTSAGWTDWQKQAMDNYIAIQRNTADTVVECRRAANACEDATQKLNRIIKVKGATSGVNVFLN